MTSLVSYVSLLFTPLFLITGIYSAKNPALYVEEADTSRTPVTQIKTRHTPITVGAYPPILTFAPISGKGVPSPEIARLVDDTSKWRNGAKHINYLSVASQWFRFNSEKDVKELLSALERNHIGLEVGSGILEPGTCGSGEGFNAEDLINAATTIKQHKGTIDIVSIDESFYFGAYGDEASGCHYTPNEVAKFGAATIAKVKSIFPQVVFGDVEPMPVTKHSGWLSDYERWLKAFEKETGSPVAFISADVQWNERAWWENLLRAEKHFNNIGIPFGIFFNGDDSSKSGAAWVKSAKLRIDFYQWARGKPDVVWVGNWAAYPDHFLPETDPSALTHVLDYYIRRRSR